MTSGIDKNQHIHQTVDTKSIPRVELDVNPKVTN